MRLDLGNRQADIILLELEADRFAYLRRIRPADDAQGTGRRHHDEAVHLPGGDGRVEPARQSFQEIPLRLFMPIGLLDRAACATHGRKGAPRRVAALLVGCRVLLFVRLPGPQVGKPGISRVLQDECLAAVTYHDPFASCDFHWRHRTHLFRAILAHNAQRWPRLPDREATSAQAAAILTGTSSGLWRWPKSDRGISVC